MKDIVKQALDEFISYSKQINLDSEAARLILAEQIAEKIQLWQNQKDQENIKKKRGLNKKISDMRGRHSKNKSSRNKTSKNYKKPYNRQGR